ncbi:MAG: MarC family protein [Rhodoplanes sp.]|uniref:MarC family protein n=1 Tax=Rhodoplanes sp. TaxID=1968906 RepID=UPI0017C31549|nr:MarC family protein [Rhodoplanes sp.]NVO17094.1 MarC family protein [Rhodoplanes sp.]
MSVEFLLSAAVTLFIVVDPLGLAPAFVALTDGLPPAARRQVGFRATLIAVAVLVGAALVGDWLLSHLGITLPAFRIAGGILLFAVASEMVLDVRMERQSRTAEQAVEERVRHVAAFPLAIPLMAGPGALTAAILLAGQAAGDPARTALLLGVIVAVCGLCLAVFHFAGAISRGLGITGNIVLARLFGVLLAALAVQYVIDGAKAVWG